MNSVSLTTKTNQNQIAFQGETKKRYLGSAVASVVIPGSGQLIKGDTGRGLAHLGIWAGIGVANFFVITKKMLKNMMPAAEKLAKTGSLKQYNKDIYKGISKTRWGICGALCALAFANMISSVVNAYKGQVNKAE